MRFWIAYQLLRISCRLLPTGVRSVIEYQINDAIDMGLDPARRDELREIIARAKEEG